jgi:hypothetical protein
MQFSSSLAALLVTLLSLSLSPAVSGLTFDPATTLGCFQDSDCPGNTFGGTKVRVSFPFHFPFIFDLFSFLPILYSSARS